MSNCKILSSRVLNFNMNSLYSVIRKNLKKTEDFFYETYKGFYCSICNFENQKFFNTQDKVVTYSEKFCRDIVEHNLPNLLFFHVHFNRYANLVNKFLYSCDFKGDFSAENPIPRMELFLEDPSISGPLLKCK